MTTATETWLAERKTGIGASDAPQALGLKPSKFKLWAEKTGMAERPDLDDLEYVEWGKRLEGPIAEAYQERTGRDVVRNDTNDILRHPDRPYVLCTIDALQSDGVLGEGLLEIKTAGQFFTGDWKDDPPLHYQVQLQHQLAVTGLPWGTLCVLIGGQRMLWFDQTRNERFIQALLDKEAEFWRLVEERRPPEPDGSEATAATLRQLYPADDGEIITLPDEALTWDKELTAVKTAIKQLDEEKRKLENRLKAAIGTASIGVLPDGGQYTYKQQVTKVPAKGAYEKRFRVLRRKKA